MRLNDAIPFSSGTGPVDLVSAVDDDAAAVALLLLCAPRAVELGRLAVADIAPSSGHLVMLLTRKGGRTDAVPARPLLETLTAGRVRPLTHRVYEASAAV